jgi:hypothetical protein
MDAQRAEGARRAAAGPATPATRRGAIGGAQDGESRDRSESTTAGIFPLSLTPSLSRMWTGVTV